jgi:excisionase family DNA binding protein
MKEMVDDGSGGDVLTRFPEVTYTSRICICYFGTVAIGYDDTDSIAGTGVEILREPLLDAEQAAALLGIPRSSVYEYAKRGELPHVKIGRHLKFIGSDLEHALVERRVGI